MNVEWDSLDRAAWEGLHREYGSSLQQSWAYGQALRQLGVGIHRAAIRVDGEVMGLAQFMVRRIAGYLSLASCTRGPVWHTALTPYDRAQAIRLLKQSLPVPRLRVALFSPDAPASPEVDAETHGLWRVMTGYSTVMLDLRQDLGVLRQAQDGKWRNRLVKAEASEMLVRVGPDRRLCSELLERERWQRAKRNFYGLPTAFVDAYLDAHDAQSPGFWVASAHAQEDAPAMASMLFLRHGRLASYYIGWADEAGRKLNAHNRLLWQAMVALQQQGVTDLDLGGINTHDLPGISRFKLGTGGRVLTLAGTYF